MEGAWGRVSPEWISVFPDENLKKEMAERLLQEGEITGEEYLAIMMGPGKLKIYGVEEKELYEVFAKNSEELRSKEIAHEVKSGKKINKV